MTGGRTQRCHSYVMAWAPRGCDLAVASAQERLDCEKGGPEARAAPTDCGLVQQHWPVSSLCWMKSVHGAERAAQRTLSWTVVVLGDLKTALMRSRTTESPAKNLCSDESIEGAWWIKALKCQIQVLTQPSSNDETTHIPLRSGIRPAPFSLLCCLNSWLNRGNNILVPYANIGRTSLKFSRIQRMGTFRVDRS